MAEDATTTEVEETEETTTETEAQEAEVTEETKAEETEEDSLENLPEWAQREIKNLRTESAKHRTGKKELAEALSKAKSPEEFEEAVKVYEGKVTELERELALSKYDLPEDFLPLLEGKTAEEINKIAPDLAKYAPKSNSETSKKEKSLDDLSGGLTPTSRLEGSELSAEELAKRIPRRR